MARFTGREVELARLISLLDRVREEGPDGRPGRAVLIRGRRRVGKSRLVEVFLNRMGLPSVYFTASMQPPALEVRMFAAEVAASTLPGANLFDGVEVTTWDGAFRLLAAALPTDGPSIVVLDELPYLTLQDPGFEGTLQKAFDRELSRRPVLLIGVGSDLAMMEALNTYGRPFYQRATEMVVYPLSPSEVGSLVGAPTAADAFDAHLVTGGLPLLCDEWRSGRTLWDYLTAATADPLSALLVSGERTLAAELPEPVQARHVLTAIGTGERTFGSISRQAGSPVPSTLNRSLGTLVDKRLIAVDKPLSNRPTRDKRYRIADPYLRFWLAFLGGHLDEVERGRGDRVLARIRAGWTSWRGRAIEPVVREALERLDPDERPPGTEVIGGYWTRTNDPEIDLVGADRGPIATAITALGSIKWLENTPFGDAELARLINHRWRMPGADETTPLMVVSRSGTTVEGRDGVWTYDPDNLLAAWPPQA